MEYVKFTDIKPADYNPRRISDSAFVELKGSLKNPWVHPSYYCE